MSLSATEIGAVIGEIAPLLRDGWIQKISQPTPSTLTLEIRTPGTTYCLLISTHSDTARLHLTTHRLASPPTPPSFCQFLRAHIQGARVEAIEQVQSDRIVRIALSAREGPGSLIAELVGKKADVLLLVGDKVVASLNRSAERIGQGYEPPVLTAAHRAREEPYRFLQRAEAEQSLSQWLDIHYQQQEQELAFEHLRQNRLTLVRKSLKKSQRRIEALQADIEKATKYRDYARYGELLKANLGSIKKGQEKVTVVDYFDEQLPELTIPLDPIKSPQGNMDDYFKKHRKHLAAEREIKPRLESAEREVVALRKELAELQQSSWQPKTQDTTASSKTGGSHRPLALASAAPKSERRGPFRRFTSADGLPIYVGRNARENEELTFGLAKSDDLWLHAHGTPGSHVVVRLEKGAEPPPDTIKDAATLALLYSDLKKSGKGEVIYARRKWVRKVKGQPPGTVTVTQEKSIYVNLDKTRLEALKQRARSAP